MADGNPAELKNSFFQHFLLQKRKTRGELMKAIDFEYYGYLDEGDGRHCALGTGYEKKRGVSGISRLRLVASGFFSHL